MKKSYKNNKFGSRGPSTGSRQGKFGSKFGSKPRGKFNTKFSSKSHSDNASQSDIKEGKTSVIRTKGPSPIPTRLPGEFPMRINKYLSWKGFATRQGADDLIKKKIVTINGRLAVLGDQVQATDAVELRSRRAIETYVYYAYNKPRGINTVPSKTGKDISQSINLKGVFPVGSLETNSDGLIILTNDRRLVDRLLNPLHSHMKDYVVRTVNPVKPNFKEKMEAGVILGNAGKQRGAANAKPIQCNVHMIRDNIFNVHVADSDTHVRQMCSLFFAEVDTVTRTEILNVRLEKLPTNTYRNIEGEELKTFLASLGL